MERLVLGDISDGALSSVRDGSLSQLGYTNKERKLYNIRARQTHERAWPPDPAPHVRAKLTSRRPRSSKRVGCRIGRNMAVPPGTPSILMDITIMKVGCPILQAILGGNSRVPKHVDSDRWFMDPTDNMKLYYITSEQEDALIRKLGGVP